MTQIKRARHGLAPTKNQLFDGVDTVLKNQEANAWFILNGLPVFKTPKAN